jgi:rare lipoprotein A
MRFHMGLRAPRALVASFVLGSAGAAIGVYPMGAQAVSTLSASSFSAGGEELTVMPTGQAALPATFPSAGSAPVHTNVRLRRLRLNVLGGERATVAGVLRPGIAGQTVTLQALTRRGWRTLTHTLTRSGGRFVLRYRSHETGSRPVRVRFAGEGPNLGSQRFAGELNVYRLAGASWYGGGGEMACGGFLTSSTLGVANKTLPCGTFVTLRYDGRTVRVPVVDRGPYVAGRDFDLTEATKRALGFEGVADVWSTR